MKTLLLIIALTATATASPEMIDAPLGFSVWHEDHWDHDGIHVDTPQAVPEPSSPLVMLVSAGLALLGRRHRKGRIRERRVDLRTVEYR
jgi:hypothetical protein